MGNQYPLPGSTPGNVSFYFYENFVYHKHFDENVIALEVIDYAVKMIEEKKLNSHW